MKIRKIVLILLTIISIVIVSGIDAVEIKKDTEQLTLGDPTPPIELGKMTIMDGTTKIKLKNDNLIKIKDGNQSEIYHFVIDYEFKEGSNVNQEKWVFTINMSGILDTSAEENLQVEHSVIFEDHYYNNDEARGEIWIDISGEDIWLENNNFITVDCKRYADILWISDFNLIDQANENVLIRAENFPAPELTWSTPDGAKWEVDETGSEKLFKTFVLTNTGRWPTENAEIKLTSDTDAFQLETDLTTVSLDPDEQHSVVVSFTPSSRGKKSANLTSTNDNEWYFKGEKLQITGEVPKSKAKIKNFFDEHNIILERMPLVLRLLKLL